MEHRSLYRHIHHVFLGTNLFSSPIGALYRLLPFILVKELSASPLQITLFISSAPIVALLSFYANLIIRGRPQMLKPLITGGTLLICLPCLLFPFVSNVWFFLLCYASYMMARRAKVPAWMELLRLHVPAEGRGRIFSRGATINYLANIVFPMAISPLLDFSSESWRWIFAASGLLQACNLLLLPWIEVPATTLLPQSLHFQSLKDLLIAPWKSCWKLVKENASFRNYQIVFALGGGGLMLMQPILPLFFQQTLDLSYTQLAFAISVCKGVGFALTSPLWAPWLHRLSIHLFNSYVTLFAGAFALIIAFARAPEYIYLAYFVYGVMQAGSELSWNLSGPIFSKQEDSTLYTSVNIAMVGLRGCCFPFAGDWLFMSYGAGTVFVCSALLCLLGSVYSFRLSEEKAEKQIV